MAVVSFLKISEKDWEMLGVNYSYWDFVENFKQSSIFYRGNEYTGNRILKYKYYDHSPISCRKLILDVCDIFLPCF